MTRSTFQRIQAQQAAQAQNQAVPDKPITPRHQPGVPSSQQCIPASTEHHIPVQQRIRALTKLRG